MPVRTPPVVTRFAPSPTGHLHIGGARSALFCWAFARRHNGHFLLRIEDTDQARSSIESARGIMEDLAWLGIDWDEGPVLERAGMTPIGGDPRGVGPFFQAQRVEIYNQYLRWMVENEKAYPAFDSTEELEVQRNAAKANKQTFRYNRESAMSLPLKERLARIDGGVPHVIRLLAPPGAIVVKDQVLGDVTYAPGELDDFVLRKADGFPTYHFAVVIDDELMGVTHVMRAQEHLNNTPRHVALQGALRRLDTGEPFRTPIYGHMPLIFNMDSTKMSKRDKAKAARAALKQALQKTPGLTLEKVAQGSSLDLAELTAFHAADNDSLPLAGQLAKHFNIALPEIEVSDFRDNGYIPEAIINFLGLLGWNPGMKLADGKDLEKFDIEFLKANFAIDRIGKTSARFDRTKLASFNGDYLAALPLEKFASRWADWCAEHSPVLLARAGGDTPDDTGRWQRWLWLASAVKQRARTFGDTLKPASFITMDDHAIAFDPAAVEKALNAQDKVGRSMLKSMRDGLATMPEFLPGPIHDLIEQVGKAYNQPNMGPAAAAIRVSLTGTNVSPPLGESMAVLGRESCLARIDRCLGVA
jgi:glutamyl/glutaminyl-tRNA synthetase